MKRRSQLLFRGHAAAALAASLLAGSLQASTVARLSTSGLVAKADRILTGRCSKTESAWMDGTLVTLATFEVRESLKGKSAAPVVVVIPGGIDFDHVPPLQLVYPGAPQVTTGEESLLFLQTLDDTTGTAVLVGFAQGLFHLPASGQKAQRDLSQLTLLETGGRRSHGAAESTEVEALLAEIRALVAAEVEP